MNKSKIEKRLKKHMIYNVKNDEFILKADNMRELATEIVKLFAISDVSISLVDTKFMKWLSKEAPELCESLYGCIHKYETNEC